MVQEGKKAEGHFRDGDICGCADNDSLSRASDHREEGGDGARFPGAGGALDELDDWTRWLIMNGRCICRRHVRRYSRIRLTQAAYDLHHCFALIFVQFRDILEVLERVFIEPVLNLTPA